MEDGRTRELRHDFRAYYSVSYDEVPADEAIDLILTLPWGSAYRAAGNPAAEWDGARYQMANVLDALSVINWRLMGCPNQYRPEPVERPGDRQRREQLIAKARSIRKRIEETEWKEA